MGINQVTSAGYQGPPLDVEQLQAARLWVTHHRPYYAAVLYRCPVVVSDLIPTLAVDVHWRLYINPVFAATLSVTELATVLIHEVNHLLRDHAGRAEAVPVHDESQRWNWNLAADAEINDDLRDDRLHLDSWILPETIGCRDDDVAEHYYRHLSIASGPPPEVAPGPHHECGSGAGAARSDGELDAEDQRAPAVSDVEAAIVRRQVAQEISDYGTGRGTVPRALQQWAHGILKPVVDWRRVLAGTVRGSVAEVAGSADYSYRRFSRRTSAVPEIRLPGMVTRLPVVAVVVDTSGSMSNLQIAQAFGEVQGILRSCGVPDYSVTVLTVDDCVASIKRVSDVRSVTTMGRGGTDMSEGTDAAAKLRPRPDLVMVLTDGYTPWPAMPYPGIRMIVGLVGDFTARDDVPEWATVVEIPIAR